MRLRTHRNLDLPLPLRPINSVLDSMTSVDSQVRGGRCRHRSSVSICPTIFSYFRMQSRTIYFAEKMPEDMGSSRYS